MKDASGKDIPGRLCYNSARISVHNTGGYLEFIKQVAGEMMRYEIRGFHFDMLDFGFGPPYGCWCARCREAFRDEYGRHGPDVPGEL
jgi:DNA-dependent RNA polymerase auxiliary subunit epsilon